MIWVSIILGILEALPGLITAIKQIWEAIHPSATKSHAFLGLLLKHKDISTASTPEALASAEADIRAFHAKHVLGVSA